jgi:hypothetical protein
MFLISCSDIFSDYQEKEQILDYQEYIYQGWNAFETVNLNELEQDSANAYYYELALDMFEASVQSIDYEFTDQNLIGPHYKSYNGIGWTQLYYSSEFSDPSIHYKRDSLRQESKIYFDKSSINILNIDSLESQNQNSSIVSQDRCDTYSGLSYIYYYNSLNDSSLIFSEDLLNECPEYSFNHDELDFRNIHYLRGKIYLFKENYSQACIEIKQANGCECNSGNVDIDILLDCFDQFQNGE